LKLKSSRETFKLIREKFDVLPFTIRSIDKTHKVGLHEIEKNGLIDAFPVLCENSSENVVHLKQTLFLMKQTVVGTSTPLQKFTSDKKHDKETLEFLNSLTSSGKKKKKDKKKEDKMQVE
jgi:hypothetical protein